MGEGAASGGDVAAGRVETRVALGLIIFAVECLRARKGYVCGAYVLDLGKVLSSTRAGKFLGRGWLVWGNFCALRGVGS